MSFSDIGDFGEGFASDLWRNAAGPLIGGGLTQAGIILTKTVMPRHSKWAGLLGTLLGGTVSAILAFSSSKHRDTGLAALATAIVIGVPRQIEDLLGLSVAGYDLGVYTTERLGDYGAYTTEQLSDGSGQIELMDSGSGGYAAGEAMTGEGGIEILSGGMSS